MIEFFSENDFKLNARDSIVRWIGFTTDKSGFTIGDISYVFCDNEFLHTINLEYLNHDTYTDIISFDYSMGKQLNGEIYISTEMIAANAKEFQATFDDELLRVIIHGILHFMGHKDKTEEESMEMRKIENEAILLYNEKFKSL